jgi:WD repeat-containing protein 89
MALVNTDYSIHIFNLDMMKV